MLPPAADFAAAMRRFGVSDDSRIVTYSTANPQWATRVWWVLRVFGFDNAAVLNGGFQKWAREGRAVETGPAKPRPAGTFSERAAKPLMADKHDVLAAIGDGAVCTINALQATQHAGVGGNSYGRPGRIKGSVNVPTVGLLDPATNTFLPPAALRAQFDAVHAFDRKVITYCGGGIAASATAHSLVMLGHPDVRLYDASMSEMGGRRDSADGGRLTLTRLAPARRARHPLPQSGRGEGAARRRRGKSEDYSVGLAENPTLPSSAASSTVTSATTAARGPWRHASISDAIASSVPAASSSTPPSLRLRTNRGCRARRRRVRPQNCR